MPQALYHVYNGPSPTGTTPPQKITTGAGGVPKTLLQLLHPSLPISVIEWGISFDGTAAATPLACDLAHTTTIAATVTAYVANDVTLMSDPGGSVPGLTLSTAGSGYTSSAEGAVVAPVRIGDYQLVAPTNQYVKQFPLGQEFVVPAAGVLRIRVTASSAVNAACYITFAVG